jgi:pSer/pThr/pTyr-binding forkhead associated (FHA) protein
MELVVLDGRAAKERFEVRGPSIVIGRAPDCDVVLLDQEASRHHARISLVDGRYVIEDVQAANPTVLNDQVLAEAHILENGDLIVIGSVLFQVQGVAEPDPPAAAAPKPRATRPEPDRPSGPRRGPASSPVETLRGAASRLTVLGAGLGRSASALLDPTHGLNRRSHARQRLGSLLAEHAQAGGNAEVERVRRLLPDASSNQTDVRSLYPLGQHASALARAATLAQRSMSVLEELAEQGPS